MSETGAVQHIVMFSGGVCSYCAAKRVIERHGAASVTLLFADTLIEDGDLYRFLGEAEQRLGAPVTRIADGRTPWEVFRDRRFIGNSRIDPCSQHLKRDLLNRWVRERYGPDECVLYFGLDWNEEHRLARVAARQAPYRVEAPMLEPPLLDKREMLAILEADGIAVPRLYGMGFAHNNCGGFCIKAGKAHFKLLLERLPEVYAYHEAEEEKLRQHLGKDVSVLRDRRGGTTKPMTLAQFREELKGGCEVDPYDIGGCGCAVD